MVKKSLITGEEYLSSILMTKLEGKLEVLNKETGIELLKKYWAPKVTQNKKNMRSLEDESGIVFDLPSKMADAFIDGFDELKENFSRVEFEVCHLKSLPELKDPSDDPDPPEEEEEPPMDEEF